MINRLIKRIKKVKKVREKHTILKKLTTGDEMKNILFSLIAILSFGQAIAAKTDQMICENGSILKVAYPTNNLAIVEEDDQLHLLKIAVSASGARYIGDHLQWWTKGNTGNLAKLKAGEKYAEDKGINCQLIKYDNKP